MSVIQFTVSRIRYRNRNSDKHSITFLFLLPSFTNIKSYFQPRRVFVGRDVRNYLKRLAA